MSEIFTAFLEYGGPWAALFSLVIAGVVVGYLTTPRALRKMEAAHAELLKMSNQRGDEYKSAWETERTARLKADQRVDEMLEMSRASRDAWESLTRAATRKAD